jgi:hypothetical protein
MFYFAYVCSVGGVERVNVLPKMTKEGGGGPAHCRNGGKWGLKEYI